jgi:hypothetical protein
MATETTTWELRVVDRGSASVSAMTAAISRMRREMNLVAGATRGWSTAMREANARAGASSRVLRDVQLSSGRAVVAQQVRAVAMHRQGVQQRVAGEYRAAWSARESARVQMAVDRARVTNYMRGQREAARAAREQARQQARASREAQQWIRGMDRDRVRSLATHQRVLAAGRRETASAASETTASIGAFLGGMGAIGAVAAGITSTFVSITASIGQMAAGLVTSTLRIVEMREAAVTTLGVTMGGRGRAEIGSIGSAAVQRAQQLARATPISLAEAVEAQQQVAGGFRARSGDAGETARLQERMLAAFTDVQTLRGGPQAQSFLLQMSQLRNSSRPLMSDIRPIAQALGMSVMDIRTATAERAGVGRRAGETDVSFEARIGAAERSGRISGETMSEGILSLLTQRTGMGLGGFAQARGQGLGAAMSNLAEAPTNLIATIAGIENSPGVAALARTMSTIGDVMAGVGPQGARLQALISGLVDSVGGGLGGLLSPERVTAAFGALLDVVGMVDTAVRSSVGPLLDGLSQGFGSVSGGTQTWQQQLQALLSYLPAMANGLGLIVGYSARITAGFVAAGAATLVLISWFRSIPTELAFIFQSAVTFFSEIGTQIVDGLLAGLRGGWTRVTSVVSSLASSIPATVRVALGIASPSRVMAELGAYTAEGFAVGVDGGAGGAQRAMRDLVSPPSPGSLSGGRFGDINITVNASGNADSIAEAVRAAVLDVLTDTFDRAAVTA